MSFCRSEGKDKIIFVTKEDHDVPSTALISLDPNDEEPGLILANGDINWECPCLGGMASGPCGVPFRDAFSCFHYSEADPKGSDCYEQFKKMQDCMTSYPDVYPSKDDEEQDESKDNSSEDNTTNNSQDAAVSDQSTSTIDKTEISEDSKVEVKKS